MILSCESFDARSRTSSQPTAKKAVAESKEEPIEEAVTATSPSPSSSPSGRGGARIDLVPPATTTRPASADASFELVTFPSLCSPQSSRLPILVPPFQLSEAGDSLCLLSCIIFIMLLLPCILLHSNSL